MHGTIAVSEAGSHLFTAVYDKGNIMGLVRQMVASPENEPMQCIKVGEMGICIPKIWSCEVINDCVAYIKIPEANNVQIIFSISEYMDNKKDEIRNTIKNGYINKYASGYSKYIIASENSENDGNSLLDNDKYSAHDKYNVQLTFFNGENILDIFSHSTFRHSTSTKTKTYTVTTIIEDGEYDYSEAAQYITNTMKNWDAIQEDINKEITTDAKKAALKYLEGEVDWNGLESTVQKITEQDMLDHACPKDSLVLMEGVISNISDSKFDLWIPHCGTYSYTGSWKYSVNLDGIQEGCTVEVCTATHEDGSLKQAAEEILAIRKLDVPIIDDIVAQFKNSCKNFEYNTVMRNPDNAYGTIWKARGTVFQVVKSDDSTQEFLLQLNDGNYIITSYSKKAGDDNLLEGDAITIYGTFYNIHAYITLLGEKKTVPRLNADYIDFG